MASTPWTSEASFETAYSRLFETFSTGRTKKVAWRKWQLKQCWWMIVDNEAKMVEAMKTDLNRTAFESYTMDIGAIKKDILETLKHVEEWAADERIDAGFIMGTLGKARIRKEPLGVAFIIGAWNFPFLLCISPLLAAIAAGCCVMMKPSEVAAASQNLLVDMIRQYLDPQAVQVVTGGAKETTFMLKHRFDHIFYTGSVKVAGFITAAAARHLTPTVLELGGQGPAIITKSANIDLAAKRVAYVKFLNAGQICLSVNHVFADPSIHDSFVQRLAFWNDHFLSKGADQMVRVNDRNFNRLDQILASTNGTISYGGERDLATRKFTPTVVTDVEISDSLLSEELFGPVCPVIKADYVTAYKQISKMPHPLGLYIFSSSQTEIDEILCNTNSGGVTINDCMIHAGVPNAPFGGVGSSGMGAYHGVYGFKAFTHMRTVVAMPTWLEGMMKFRYPPFSTENVKKVVVKNSLGFKRGETIEDQTVGGGSWLIRGQSMGFLVKVALLAMAMGFADERSGHRLGVAGLLDFFAAKALGLVK